MLDPLMEEITRSRLHRFFFPGDIISKISSEEHRKRIYVYTGISLVIPIIIGFIISYFVQGIQFLLVLPDIITVTILLVSVLFLRRSVDSNKIYRLNMLMISGLVIYDAALGLFAGGDVLWLYTYPLVAFFMFGKKEGIIWITVVMSPSTAFIMFPELLNSFEFELALKQRFFISLSLVILLSYLLESLRKYFYDKLQEQKKKLEEALDNVKVLNGLLPICSSCKNIRNDKGYWQTVDNYITTHTDVQFTHGICDKCLKIEAPKTYYRMVRTGEINPREDIE